MEIDARRREADTTARSSTGCWHRDGDLVWIRDDAVLVQDSDGTERWHGVLSDISEQKQAEAELARSAAQQAAVARLGEHALEGASPHELMQEAVGCVATLLEVEIAGVLELIRDDHCFILRAGVGWPQERWASSRSPIGSKSQSGYTILGRRSGDRVRLVDRDQRSSSPGCSSELGAQSGASVTIDGRGGPARGAGRPVDSSPELHRAETSTFSRRWRTCSPTRSSARRSRTASATGRSTTRSPACPTGCCSSTGWSTRSRA